MRRDSVRFVVVGQIILLSVFVLLFVHRVFLHLYFFIFLFCFYSFIASYREILDFHFRRRFVRRIFDFTRIGFFFFFNSRCLTVRRHGWFRNFLNEKLVQFQALTDDVLNTRVKQKIVPSMPRVLFFPGFKVFLFIAIIGIVLISDSVFAVLIRDEQLSSLLFFRASDVFVDRVRVSSVFRHVRHRPNSYRWNHHFSFRLCHAKRRFSHSTLRHSVHRCRNRRCVRFLSHQHLFRVQHHFFEIRVTGWCLKRTLQPIG